MLPVVSRSLGMFLALSSDSRRNWLQPSTQPLKFSCLETEFRLQTNLANTGVLVLQSQNTSLRQSLFYKLWYRIDANVFTDVTPFSVVARNLLLPSLGQKLICTIGQERLVSSVSQKNAHPFIQREGSSQPSQQLTPPPVKAATSPHFSRRKDTIF